MYMYVQKCHQYIQFCAIYNITLKCALADKGDILTTKDSLRGEASMRAQQCHPSTARVYTHYMLYRLHLPPLQYLFPHFPHGSCRVH